MGCGLLFLLLSPISVKMAGNTGFQFGKDG